MATTYTLNPDKNGVEIRFDCKPPIEILEMIKAAGYRWSRPQKLWWAKQSEQTLAIAKNIADNVQIPSKPPVVFDLWEATRWVPGPGGDECSAHTVGSNYKSRLSTKEIAAIVKRELCRRFPSTRWSVTSDYLAVEVRLKSGPYENNQTEDFREWENTSPELSAIIEYAEKLLNSYNWDDSNPYADYSSQNFYGSVKLYKYQQTEPTEMQRQEVEKFRTRLKEEKRKKEMQLEQEWKAEQERRTKQQEEYALKDELARKAIANLTVAADIRDLADSERYMIPHVPMVWKAANVKDAREAIEEGAVGFEDCIILEEITAPRDLLNKFGETALLRDVPEIFRRVGGSYTNDPRITSMNDYDRMSKEERESVKWYALAVAIYTTEGELWAVVDDEGFSYARYIAIAPWDGCNKRERTPDLSDLEREENIYE